MYSVKENIFQCVSHLPWICHCGTLNHRKHSIRVFSANLLGGFLKTALSTVLCDTKFHGLTMLQVNFTSSFPPPSLFHRKGQSTQLLSITVPMPLTALSMLSNSVGFLCSSSSIFQQRRSRLHSSLWYGEQYFKILLSSYHREKCDNYDHTEDSKPTERYRMACFLFYSLFLF